MKMSQIWTLSYASRTGMSHLNLFYSYSWFRDSANAKQIIAIFEKIYQKNSKKLSVSA